MSDFVALERSLQLGGAPGPPIELRVHRRYPLSLALQYKCLHDRRRQQMGSGTTVNISRGGVLFRSNQMPPLQSRIELALNWPVSLDDCALKLVIRGRVVRRASEMTAVRVIQYEFRIAGRQFSALA